MCPINATDLDDKNKHISVNVDPETSDDECATLRKTSELLIKGPDEIYYPPSDGYKYVWEDENGYQLRKTTYCFNAT